MYFRLNNIYCKRFITIKNEIITFDKLSQNFLNIIDKYNKDKIISIKIYKNKKQEIKQCIQLISKSLNNLNKKDFEIIFTNCILLSRRILFPSNITKDFINQYILIKNKQLENVIENIKEKDEKDKIKKEKNEQDEIKKEHKEIKKENEDIKKENKEIKKENEEIKRLFLTLQYLLYLNIDYDKNIYNNIYIELNNTIELFTLEELIKIIKLLSSFKNNKWINNKIFAKCIDEIIKKKNEINEQNKIFTYLIIVIKSCSRIGYEIDNIKILINDFIENYKKNNDIHILIKILYNLFLCNFFDRKYINDLLNLLKNELLPIEKEKEYPIYKKYLFNDLIIDNNYDAINEINKNNNIFISNDNIDKIHELYFNTKNNILNNQIKYISLYRLKFIEIFLRSDTYLYNSFYIPNIHFLDFIKKINYENKEKRESIFTKQVKFFIKENGFHINKKYIDIYDIYFLENSKNVCIELIENIFINKKMKNFPNKFHKNNLNYKLKHLKLLEWNIITLYEYEWKKLKNYNEKFEYIKKKFKDIKINQQ